MTFGPASGVFVTGTDTGVGKTLVACALLHAFAARGLRTAGMKPVAAGARRRRGGQLKNDDVELLRTASSIAVPDRLINVYAFEPPIAPHIAARSAGRDIELAAIERAYLRLARQADVVVVEGVGGFCVPLNEREDAGDLAVLLHVPVVLVVGMRLGCLNHALLTAAAIEARGLTLAGWTANHIDPGMTHVEENVAALSLRLRAPCIARIPFQRVPEPRRIAGLFAVDLLLREA
ncbi:MAG: dethiobiotin synthase [Betaproteobacteria bacterium]